MLNSLNLNWFKNYDTNQKHVKSARNRLGFFTKSQKYGNENIDVLSHNFWTN